MPDFIVKNHLQRALLTAGALVCALLCDRYYSLAHEYWMPITTLLLMQMTTQSNFRQVLQSFLAIVVVMLLVTIMLAQYRQTWLIPAAITGVLVGCCYALWQISAATRDFPVLLILVSMFLLLLAPFQAASMHDRLQDVVVGGGIGIVANLLIFTLQTGEDFRSSLIVVLQGFSEYLAALTDLFLEKPAASSIAMEKKILVEKNLQRVFPERVYEPGFNPVFQQGHRHFLLRLEKIAQILFAMLESFQELILRSTAQAEKIFSVMCAHLDMATVSAIEDNFFAEIAELEKNFHLTVRMPLELLEMSGDYLTLAAFIYDLKDLQKNLFKLMEALR
jgi:uncharacterized membrane protein YgaE (UPF0421/DUF939 family)